MKLLHVLFLSLLLTVSSFSQEIFNIGLCVTATGKYSEFAQRFIKSCRKHFFKGHNVKYFIFTDDENYPEKEDEVAVYQKRLGWPFDTLMRFEIYLRHKNLFQDLDYIFASDADMLYVSDVGVEMLGDLVATIHPGFFNKKRPQYSYETNKRSSAYIAPREGEYYFAGGFYGGTFENFLNLLKKTSKNIKKDLSKNVIAVWHDESHLNRFFIDNPPEKKLTPAYCYPENWDLPFEKKMLALDKNHEEIRK